MLTEPTSKLSARHPSSTCFSFLIDACYDDAWDHVDDDDDDNDDHDDDDENDDGDDDDDVLDDDDDDDDDNDDDDEWHHNTKQRAPSEMQRTHFRNENAKIS